ncbi:RHS repeat-associated core domain-containing protein, partial [Oscillatoria amoena NRMC-F 0135]|nr:RHS repeat-associated core domain-containing protein [Oscillatoria amoena NRMC-F 0135]
GSGGSSTGPKAFVNIIVFDKNYKLLDAAWKAIDPAAYQDGVSPIVLHDSLALEYTAKEEGYVYLYVSNENPTLVEVYFDDVVMTHTKSNIIQYNEYYPFGLQTANSWTRENTTGNNFLYNGGTELNTTTTVYDLFFRNYDPALGRMNQVDPMAAKYASLTPYNYSFNNPITFNDPSGADPFDDWLEEQRALQTWFDNTMPVPMDPGGGSSNSSYYGSVMGGYGVQVGAYLNSMGYYNLEQQDAMRREVERQQRIISNAIDKALAFIAGVKEVIRIKQTSGRTFWGKRVQTGGEVVTVKEQTFKQVYFQVQTQGGGCWWCTDKQGEFLFDHWQNGKGKELFLNDAEWSAYMKANSYLATVSIASHLYGLGIKDSQPLKGSFHGETGVNGISSGYGMLNGSNSRVGDLQYSGYAYAHNDGTGTVSYLLTFTWNDIMDPNFTYIEDRIGAKIFPGTPYNVHITWTDVIVITPK